MEDDLHWDYEHEHTGDIDSDNWKDSGVSTLKKTTGSQLSKILTKGTHRHSTNEHNGSKVYSSKYT